MTLQDSSHSLVSLKGLANYSALAPGHSFINAMDFASPKHLADYLKYLDSHDDEYLAYFKWKQNFGLVLQDHLVRTLILSWTWVEPMAKSAVAVHFRSMDCATCARSSTRARRSRFTTISRPGCFSSATDSLLVTTRARGSRPSSTSFASTSCNRVNGCYRVDFVSITILKGTRCAVFPAAHSPWGRRNPFCVRAQASATWHV